MVEGIPEYMKKSPGDALLQTVACYVITFFFFYLAFFVFCLFVYDVMRFIMCLGISGGTGN